jgi:hypothetical protein
MHTRHSVRWLSSVAALAAGVIGLGVPLAAPAAAAAQLTVTAAQPRYAVATEATIDVTASTAIPAGNLTMTVTNGPDVGITSTCTELGATNQWICQFTNAHGTGSDTVVVTDATNPATQSAAATVSFETIAAAPSQSLYGTGETATFNVQVTTGPASTPVIKGSIAPGGADSGQFTAAPISCTANGVAGSWTCSFTNNGTAGTDTVTIFDDDSPSGTAGTRDPTEPAVGALTVNFEKITATPDNTRSTTTTDVLDVNVTGIPAGHAPAIKESLVTGPNDSIAPGCTMGAVAAGAASGTCTVQNNGRSDNPVVKVYDDLNNDATAEATEPQTTTTFSFETLTATDPNAGSHVPGSTATVDVTLSNVPAGETPSVDFEVVAGPDSPATAVVNLCQGAGTAWTCTITNSHGAGTDTLGIFDDSNNNDAFNAGEPSTDINVTFGGAVTATPASGNFAVSGTAVFTAHATGPVGETPQLQYKVTSGPDLNQTAPCTPLNGGTSDWTCTVTNGGTAGLDVIQIGDINQSPPPEATVKANFEAPTAITLTPQLAPGQHSAEVAVGGCQVYSVDISPALTEPVTINISQDLGQAQGGLLGIGATPPAQSLSTCVVPGGSTVSVVSHTETASGGDPVLGLLDPPTYTDTLVLSGSTGQIASAPGRFVFGLSSTTPGTVSVAASTQFLTTGAQALSVVKGGQTAVKIVTASPATQNITTGGTATFTLLAQDVDSTPLPGVTIDYVVDAGSPDAKATPVACPPTDAFGTTKCTLTAGSTLGTDTLTFFAPQTTGETAPAASDPQTTAKVVVQQAAPPGSTLSLTCPDELVSDDNQLVSNCTVTTGSGGQQTVIFVGHVASATNSPIANIPVQFAIVSAPLGASATTGNVDTNANGNALFAVTETNPAAGDKITVQATVGTPGAGGLGPQTASATFQAPRATYVTATPAAQHIAVHGTATVTVKVSDQFGVGVGGQVVDFSVTGRNSDSGAVTTGSNGTAIINFTDAGGSGSDTVTVLDVSPNAPTSGNPSSVSVTYGSGGCTSNCGGGCTVNCGGGGTEHPALRVKQTVLANGAVRVSLVVLSHPSLVNAKVTFYQVRGGVRHVIGSGTTGGHGNVTGTLRAKPGQRLKFLAKVAGKAGVAGGFTNTVTVHVK